MGWDGMSVMVNLVRIFIVIQQNIFARIININICANLHLQSKNLSQKGVWVKVKSVCF